MAGDDVRIRDLDGRVMRDPRGFLAGARAADLVIDIGGGDSFADIYGGKRLRMMFLLKALTHLARTPLVVAPQTIGPFTKPVSSRLARATLNRSAIVATRDALSTAAAGELGLGDTEVIEASDVALRLPYEVPPPRAPGGPVKVGINVSGLLMRGRLHGAQRVRPDLRIPRVDPRPDPALPGSRGGLRGASGGPCPARGRRAHPPRG